MNVCLEHTCSLEHVLNERWIFLYSLCQFQTQVHKTWRFCRTSPWESFSPGLFTVFGRRLSREGKYFPLLCNELRVNTMKLRGSQWTNLGVIHIYFNNYCRVIYYFSFRSWYGLLNNSVFLFYEIVINLTLSLFKTCLLEFILNWKEIQGHCRGRQAYWPSRVQYMNKCPSFPEQCKIP